MPAGQASGEDGANLVVEALASFRGDLKFTLVPGSLEEKPTLHWHSVVWSSSCLSWRAIPSVVYKDKLFGLGETR